MEKNLQNDFAFFKKNQILDHFGPKKKHLGIHPGRALCAFLIFNSFLITPNLRFRKKTIGTVNHVGTIVFGSIKSSSATLHDFCPEST